MNTQVQLFDTPLSLLSIPRPAYRYFCQGVLKLLLDLWQEDLVRHRHGKDSTFGGGAARGPRPAQNKPRSRSEDNSNSTLMSPVSSHPQRFNVENEQEQDDRDEMTQKLLNVELDTEDHEALTEFINVAFTPEECSIICPTELVDLLFKESIELVGSQMGVQVLGDTYLAIKVDSDGQDTGASLLGITKPLSAASVPIFFIATYFSDYVLVPAKARHKVSKLLENRGFVFSNTANSYVVESPIGGPVGANDADDDKNDSDKVPQSPIKDATVSLRQLLEQNSISPRLDSSQKLLLTGARSNVDNSGLMLAVTKVLLRPPKFYSLTLSSGSELSFLIDSQTSAQFPPHSLLGSPTEYVCPILFDLSHLPQDSTGIVTGVAEMLTAAGRDESVVDLRYLSTALSGLALVGDDDVDVAIEVFGIEP